MATMTIKVKVQIYQGLNSETKKLTFEVKGILSIEVFRWVGGEKRVKWGLVQVGLRYEIVFGTY